VIKRKLVSTDVLNYAYRWFSYLLDNENASGDRTLFVWNGPKCPCTYRLIDLIILRAQQETVEKALIMHCYWCSLLLGMVFTYRASSSISMLTTGLAHNVKFNSCNIKQPPRPNVPPDALLS
jgi:hypothetical protein